MIGATHTHAGPGQFLGNDFYNRFASNRRGFDPAWTQFLVDQIATAAVAAYERRVPARLAMGLTTIYGLTRNRSLDPYVHNDTVADKREEPQRKFASVNPELHVLRVDGNDGARRSRPPSSSRCTAPGSRSTRTSTTPTCGATSLPRCATASARNPLSGAIEGTHADVAPAIRPGLAGHLEAARIGRGIGAQAAALYERLGDELTRRRELGCAFREVDLAVDRRIDGIELPRRPAVGAALVAGAKRT